MYGYVYETATTHHKVEPEAWKFSVCFGIKVNVVTAHVMNAYGGSSSTAPLIFKFDTKWINNVDEHFLLRLFIT
jgi:hypothetical protein